MRIGYSVPIRWSHSCCTTRAWKPSASRSIGAPCWIEAGVADARVARHHAAQAGHRQAAFPALFLVVAERRDRRIDQHRLGHRRRVRVALVAARSRRSRAAGRRRSAAPRGRRRWPRAWSRTCRRSAHRSSGVSNALTGWAMRSRRGSPIFRISRTSCGASPSRRAPPTTTSGGACTSSISTPSPPTGNSSLPFGCTKQMSWPAAPLRMPPGAKRTPCARQPLDRPRQVVDPQADVVQRRRVDRRLRCRVDRLHQVDLDLRAAPLPSAQMSSSTFSRSLRNVPSTSRPNMSTQSVRSRALLGPADRDLLDAEDAERAAGSSAALTASSRTRG